MNTTMITSPLKRSGTVAFSLLLCFFMTACGLHLKGTTILPSSLKQVSLAGIDINGDFGRALRTTFAGARSNLQVNNESATVLTISRLVEERKASAFNSNRTVSQYLLTMSFQYSLQSDGKNLGTFPVSLDTTHNYDSSYVLGEVEESEQLREGLRKDAARLILQKLVNLAP